MWKTASEYCCSVPSTRCREAFLCYTPESRPQRVSSIPDADGNSISKQKQQQQKRGKSVQVEKKSRAKYWPPPFFSSKVHIRQNSSPWTLSQQHNIVQLVCSHIYINDKANLVNIFNTLRCVNDFPVSLSNLFKDRSHFFLKKLCLVSFLSKVWTLFGFVDLEL